MPEGGPKAMNYIIIAIEIIAAAIIAILEKENKK